MRRKLVVGVIAVLAAAGGSAALGSAAGTPHALRCPSGLTQACGPVDLVTATVCYEDIPQLPTIEFITIQTSGRVITCPEL